MQFDLELNNTFPENWITLYNHAFLCLIMNDKLILVVMRLNV